MVKPISIGTRIVKDRASRKKVKKFTATFRDELGKVVKTRRLTASTYDDAVIEANRIKEELGILGDNPLVLDFLRKTWDENGDYAKTQELKYGHPLSHNYFVQNAFLVRKHLERFLVGIRMDRISVPLMESIQLKLRKEGVGIPTIQNAMLSLRTPLTNYCRKRRIPDPLLYLDKIRNPAKNRKGRGSLANAELDAIAALDIDARVKCGILLAGMAGLRLGEVRGLLLEDIDEVNNLLHISHNYVTLVEGVKHPKCNSVRDVILRREVLDQLRLVQGLPHEESEFAIWGASPMAPIDGSVLQKGFRKALAMIGIDDAERRKRNICFHSLRYSFVSNLRAAGLPDYAAMVMAGHHSQQMSDHYTKVDGKVLDFDSYREKMEKQA